MKERIIIIGAGGHGRVVVDAINAQGIYDTVGFVDSAFPIGSAIIKGCKVVLHQNDISKIADLADCFIVAIGDNSIREKLYNEAKQYLKPATIIHNKALIGSEVTIGEGTVVLANVFINTSSAIGENAIINVGVIIDHDCVIGDHVHLSIGTLVGGRAVVSNSVTTLIGQLLNSRSKV